MGSDTTPRWRQLDVGVIGGGIGGMSVGIALRRAGHLVTVYEKHDFVGEAGASVSCAANGSRWLRAWDVDVARGDPVVLRKLINRDWTTGAPVSVYDLDDYEQRWGCAYYMFHRQDMHAMLKECAMGETGRGEPVRLMVNHQCERIDLETTTIHFANGVAPRRHDLVVGADGIGSVVRGQLGIHPAKRPAESSCLHANVKASEAERLGLADFASDHALQYWGGQEGKWDKIVLSPCHGGRLLSYYCFFPRALGDYSAQQWGRPTATGAGAESRPVEELLAPFPGLDPKVKAHLEIGEEIQPWRLWIHDPYPYIQKGNACLLGDAGHPMMPHQSQGACMAIEDAAALGILLDENHFNGDVAEALAVYDEVRLPRATRVQSAAAKAAYNINERIGFSANKSCATYKVDDEKEKLTIEEMNAYDMEKDIEERLARRRGTSFVEAFCRGLPIGMQLPNGVVVGAK